jgi:hypothetical protein
LALPATAQGHGTEKHGLTPAQQHMAADSADVSVQTLERRMRAITKKLGRQPGTRAQTTAAGRVAVSVDPGESGSWSPVIAAPVVPVFEAMLPSGKILMWDSVGDRAAESYTAHTFTRAAVYDPVANTSKRVDVAGSNIFCAGFVQLANGNIFVAGGNLDSALHGIRETHVFDWKTETWSRGPDMRDGRWYPSVASMPNDEALIIGGGPTTAEVRTTSGGLRRPANIVTPSSREYPFFQAAPDGRALLMGPMRALSLIDTAGAGSITGFGDRDAIERTYGSYAPYDIGKFLVAGGGGIAEDGLTSVPTRTAMTVDTRAGVPVASVTGAMQQRRRQHNLTVLADGSVLATGGQSTMGGSGNVDLANATYNAERWDPATGNWTTLAPAAVARQYHSTAILLADGRVLTGGGGICGVCDTVGYLRRDFEIFTPPYLYRKDGSGALATRPVITNVPGSIAFDANFQITSSQAASIRKIGLVRLGAPTHGEDQSQRYVPLNFTTTSSTTRLTVRGPNNPNEAPAGPYMLFAVDSAGVPSLSKIVTLQRTLAASPAPVNLALNRPATSSTPCATTEGPEKALNGSVSGGRSDKFCTKVSTTRFLEVDLGADQTVSSFVLKFSGAGGELPIYNIRGYRIETRTAAGAYSTAVTVTDNSANERVHVVAPRAARYLRLVITAGEQNNPAGPARLFEFEAYTGAPPGTEPFVAYSERNFTGRTQRFEVGTYDVGRGNLGYVGDNAMRSLMVGNGYRATICRDPLLVLCTTVSAGVKASLSSTWDRTVSSVRVTRAP